MTNYLVTFHPLSSTRAGRLACDRFGLPPYIDGSCRREPDLQNPRPSVTALCRAGKFAPLLEVGHRVLYMTVKMTHPGGRVGWGLIAALEVVETLESHRAAYDWYGAEGLPIPSNCMVLENRPIPAHLTTGLPRDPSRPWVRWPGLGGGIEAPKGTLRDWDRGYWLRSRAYPDFVVTQPLVAPRLRTPRVLTRSELLRLFNAVPGTQSPKRLTDRQFETLQALLETAPV